MRALALGLVVLVALPLLADAGQGGRRKSSEPTQEQTVKTSSDTSNTNLAMPPAPLAEPSYGEVSLICQRARNDKAETVDDDLCRWGLAEIKERRSPHVCTSWPFWFNRWPFIRRYC